MRRKGKMYIVKLEYCLYAPTQKGAVDFFVNALRKQADEEPDRSIELLRTDVRRPGEVGEW